MYIVVVVVVVVDVYLYSASHSASKYRIHIIVSGTVQDFYRATLCISAVFAVAWCLSILLVNVIT